MTKKDYMKPAMCTVQLQNRHQILEGSYAGIQGKNDSDDDNPDYDGNGSSDIWDAN